MKVVTKRDGKEDSLKDAIILQRTLSRLQGRALIPKGVYHFNSLEEADEWMIREIASTHARLNLKT